MPAVAAIASAPQNVTRAAATATGAPPARAAMAPSDAKNTSAVAGTATSARLHGHERGDEERQQRAASEARGRGAGRLQRPRDREVGDAELVARVRAERVVRRQLVGDLLRELGGSSRGPCRCP